jgi:DNA polymerase-1
MVQLHQRLGEGGLPARLLLQVHDELVLEAAPEVLDAVLRLTRDTMEQAVTLSVPLVVETGTGDTWMDAK